MLAMNETQPEQSANVLCHCSGTTEEKIKQLVNSGFKSLDEVSRKTGACLGCGACEDAVITLLNDCC